mmetsp:Transcript_26637/g.37500  ORF Transcript_26637/g.37500 Transcript_26637/m.37500 type:complete len:718 (-) Transcript_26637:201-2354(-)|eukprot:CAMPEP_0168557658 /NCGR_PEP_ID=MMETSP0413-20121227/9545_1 /TAXON_ID=136452 /ORGANISM="Filamoeba nolandi, Strain NC-AS-23-1" /LENGTH=717 /DNA_ID=CAMNT_0008588709 /DNA_START=524 /DNA_END=2677 /DNA_ORIENTATION=+
MSKKNPDEDKPLLDDFDDEFFWQAESIESERVKIKGPVRLCKGKLNAILGNSGCGKTTLFKLILGIQEEVVPFQAQVIEKRAILKKRKDVGYCPQFDPLIEGLTIKELLDTATQLANEHDEVKNLLNEFELTVHENKTISELSGGLKKRVSIAYELAHNPKYLFLDEPTSGLDSALAEKVMIQLHQRTTKEKPLTVVAVIHQPSEEIMKKVDWILLLASKENGTAFCGNTKELHDMVSLNKPNTVEKKNWMDTLFANLDTLIMTGVQDTDPFKQSQSQIDNTAVPSQGNHTSQEQIEGVSKNAKEFLVQCKRIFYQKKNSPLSWILDVFIKTILFSLFFGWLLYDSLKESSGAIPPECTQISLACQEENIVSTGSLLLTAVSFQGFLSGITTYISERQAVRRDFLWGCSVFAYWLAKSLEAAFFQAFASIVFLLPIYWMLPLSGNFGDHFLLMWTVSVICNNIAAIISNILPAQWSNSTAIIFGGFIINLSVLFSGASPNLVKLHDSKKDYIVDQSYMRWAMDLFWGIEKPNTESAVGYDAGQQEWPQLLGILGASYVVSWLVFQVNVLSFLDISIGKTLNQTLLNIKTGHVAAVVVILLISVIWLVGTVLVEIYSNSRIPVIVGYTIHFIATVILVMCYAWIGYKEKNNHNWWWIIGLTALVFGEILLILDIVTPEGQFNLADILWASLESWMGFITIAGLMIHAGVFQQEQKSTV